MIKISRFQSLLHESNEFHKENEGFIKSIEDTLHESLVWSDLSDYDADIKLIFIASGGSEGLFLDNFSKLKEPFYFLTSGKNNSLAASLEILTYLNQIGKKGEILHGSKEYIAKRICELKENKEKKYLDGIRIGVFGKPSDWLISSIPEYKLAIDKLGVEFVDIPLSLIEKEYNGVNFTENLQQGFDQEELRKANRLYQAFLNEVKRKNLSSITVRCFDLLTSLKTTGCLSLSKLNDMGIVSSCEGDILALLSMLIANKLTGEYVFQANPSRMDLEKNEIIFAHCTIPTNMVDSFSYDTHFESKTGVAIKGILPEKEVTVFRLSKDFKQYFISNGRILSNCYDSSLCRTQILVKLDDDIKEILRNPCGNHHIIFYGHHKEKLEKLLKEIL